MSKNLDEYDVIEMDDESGSTDVIGQENKTRPYELSLSQRSYINPSCTSSDIVSSETEPAVPIDSSDKRTERASTLEIGGSGSGCNLLYDLVNAQGSSDGRGELTTCTHDGRSQSEGNTESATQEGDSDDILDAGSTEASLPSSPKICHGLIPALPHVDCPEKIVICIDISGEMDKSTFKAKAGGLYTPLRMLKKTVAMFVKMKTILDKRNTFALVSLNDTAEWLCDLTSDTRDMLYLLDNLQAVSSDSSPPLCMKSLYDIIYEKVDLPTVDGDRTLLPPPHIVRLLLLYGRSHAGPESADCETHRMLEACPYFFTDCIYVHDPVTDDNHCQMIYANLNSLDNNGRSYILEVSCNPTRVFDHMAKLLAHPLQRVVQTDTHYKIRASWVEGTKLTVQ